VNILILNVRGCELPLGPARKPAHGWHSSRAAGRAPYPAGLGLASSIDAIGDRLITALWVAVALILLSVA
jgi:hypothetical protein